MMGDVVVMPRDGEFVVEGSGDWGEGIHGEGVSGSQYERSGSGGMLFGLDTGGNVALRGVGGRGANQVSAELVSIVNEIVRLRAAGMMDVMGNRRYDFQAATATKRLIEPQAYVS